MQPMHTRESTSIQVWHIDRLTFCLVPHRKMCLRRMNEKEKFEKWSAACDNAAINRPSIRHQSWSQKGNICGSRGHYRRHVTVSRSWSFKYANLTHLRWRKSFRGNDSVRIDSRWRRTISCYTIWNRQNSKIRDFKMWSLCLNISTISRQKRIELGMDGSAFKLLGGRQKKVNKSTWSLLNRLDV